MKIVNVGQCSVDGPRMERLFKSKLHAQVANVNNTKEAQQLLEQGDVDLVTVNRELARDGSSGLDVIEALVESGSDTPVMLVSDFEDAQEEAIKLGAIRGFGKASLEAPETLDLIRNAAG